MKHKCDKIFCLAQALKKWGINSKDRVAIYLPRGVDGAIAVCAVIVVDGTYIPLNTKDPDARILNIISDSGIKLIIGKGECPLYLKNFVWFDINTVIINNKNSELTKLSILRDNKDPAAILYTSGSTGRPKGIVLSHRAIKSFADWAGKTFSISNRDNVASLAPLNFDLSFFDIFTSLSFGASVYFIPDELTMSPCQLTSWLVKHEISVWYTVPSMLSFWTSKGNLHNIALPKLRTILFAGEVLPTNVLIKLVELLPGVELYNLYGPTETNVCCYWKVDKNRLLPTIPIPIGKPACNSEIKINSFNNELMMKGPNLMSGYWNGKECILPIDKDGWFHTGDEVKISEFGEYLYIGRLDRMIKYFGYRIEPNEIEKALHNIVTISECAVVGLKGKKGKSVIGAYVVAENTTSAYIKNNLKKYLPDHMIPTFFYIADKLPRLANGKTDLIKVKEIMVDNYEP